MIHKIFLTIFFLCSVVVSDAQAISLRDCQRPIRQAMKKGWSHIGDLPLSQLLAESNGLTVNMRHANLNLIRGKRRGAEYYGEPGHGTITFNHPKNTGLNKREMTKLCVHEMMGVLAYPDKDYTFSSTILLINEERIKPNTSSTFDTYVKQLSDNYSSLSYQQLNFDNGGSGVIVIGGGDFNELDIKGRTLKYLLQQYKRGKYGREAFSHLMTMIQGCGLELFRKSPEAQEDGYFDGRKAIDRKEYELPLTQRTIGKSILYLKHPGVIYLGLNQGEDLDSSELPKRYLKVAAQFFNQGRNCRKVLQENISDYGELTLKKRDKPGLEGHLTHYWRHKCLVDNPDNYDRAKACWQTSQRK